MRQGRIFCARRLRKKQVGISKNLSDIKRANVASCAAAVSAQSVLDSGDEPSSEPQPMSTNSGLKNPRDGNAADYDAAVG